MKTIEVKTNKYQCEICETMYNDIGLAQECEAQGKPDILDDVFVTDYIVTVLGDKLTIATISKVTHYGVHINAPKIIKSILVTEFYHITSNKVIKVDLPPLRISLPDLYEKI